MISTNIFYCVIGYILLTITKVLDSLWTLFIGRFLVGKNRTIKKKNVFRPFGLLTLASQDLAVVRTLWWLPIMWVKLPKLPCEVPLPPLCSWWSLLEFCLLMPSIFMTLYIGWQSLAFVLVFLVRKSYLIVINFILKHNVAKSFQKLHLCINGFTTHPTDS